MCKVFIVMKSMMFLRKSKKDDAWGLGEGWYEIGLDLIVRG